MPGRSRRDLMLVAVVRGLAIDDAAERAMKLRGCSPDPTKIDNKPGAHHQK